MLQTISILNTYFSLKLPNIEFSMSKFNMTVNYDLKRK